MTKCGKSFMPECEYFTTGGCVSPFNCPHKTEQEAKTEISIIFNLYPLETDKDKEIARLTKECDSKEEAYNKCYFDYKYWKDKANEYKHCAEVAERALLFLCDKTMSDISVMIYPSTKTQVRNNQELYDYCIKQAEKELAEEKGGRE